MGDRCRVTLSFGGRITEAQAQELIERLAEYDFRIEETYRAPTLDTLGDDCLAAEEVNYGDVDNVTAWCRAQSIAFDYRNDAGGSYSEGVARFDGQRYEELTASECVPTIPLSRVLETETLITGMGALIDLAKFMSAPLPPLEIVPSV